MVHQLNKGTSMALEHSSDFLALKAPVKHSGIIPVILGTQSIILLIRNMFNYFESGPINQIC